MTRVCSISALVSSLLCRCGPGRRVNRVAASRLGNLGRSAMEGNKGNRTWLHQLCCTHLRGKILIFICQE